MNPKEHCIGAAKHRFLRKRVLETGGSGFLGSHLCERLLAENCDVLCVDNFFTGARENITKTGELTGSWPAIIHQPLASDDPRQRCPDITLAHTELGWQPRTDLEQGLTKTIAYFETMPGNPINKKD